MLQYVEFICFKDNKYIIMFHLFQKRAALTIQPVIPMIETKLEPT